MPRDIRFAIAGFGHIGQKHATIIKALSNALLTGIAEIKPLNNVQLELSAGVPIFNSLTSLLDNCEAEVICICTPNGLHASQAIECLNRKKNVLIEKPMGLTRTECEAVLHTALNNARQVFVVKQNRYSPPAKWLREIVSNNVLGSIHLVQINCYWNRDDRYYTPGSWKGTLELDGGTLFTQFSHFIDLLYWIFGDIKNIRGTFANASHQKMIEFEDSGLIQFELIRGGLGSISYSTAVYDQNLESSITVIGQNGSVKIGGQYMNEVLACHIKDYSMPQLPPTNPPNDYGPFKGSAANHHYVMENIIETLNGNASIGANALEGMKTVDIIERIYLQRNLNQL